jgi:hypothetical protein
MTKTKTKLPSAAKVMDKLEFLFPDFKFTYLGMLNEDRPGKFLAEHKTIAGAGLSIEMVVQDGELHLSTWTIWPKAGTDEFQREFRTAAYGYGGDLADRRGISSWDKFSNSDLKHYLDRLIEIYLEEYPGAVRRRDEYQTYLDTGGKALKQMCRITGKKYVELSRSFSDSRYGIRQAMVSPDGSTVKLDLRDLPLEDAKAVLALIIERRKESGFKIETDEDDED